MSSESSTESEDTVPWTMEKKRRWEVSYGSVDGMKVTIQHHMMRLNPSIDTSQERFTEILAELGMDKDDPDSFVRLHHLKYRWVWQYQKDMTKDGEACSVQKYNEEVSQAIQKERDTLLPQGWRWMLQLNTSGRWWDWVYIQQSNRVSANLGLFAARDFPRGSIIGYYIWKRMRVNEVVLGDGRKHKPTCMASGLVDTPCHLPIKDRKGCTELVCTRPKPIDDNNGQFLYMGMHFMNSACQSFKAGSKEYEAAKKCQNCYILEDGSFQTTKKVIKNVELLAGLSREERLENGPLENISKAGNSQKSSINRGKKRRTYN
jgi:hypothetical protein